MKVTSLLQIQQEQQYLKTNLLYVNFDDATFALKNDSEDHHNHYYSIRFDVIMHRNSITATKKLTDMMSNMTKKRGENVDLT